MDRNTKGLLVAAAAILLIIHAIPVLLFSLALLWGFSFILKRIEA